MFVYISKIREYIKYAFIINSRLATRRTAADLCKYV